MTMPMRPEVDPTKLLEELRRLSAQRPDAARVGMNPDYDPGLLRPSLPLEMGAGVVNYFRDNPLRAALDFTPGVGDALAVKDAGSDLMSAGRAAREGRVGATFGNLGMAGLNLASAIPVVGAVGDVIKGGVKGAKAARPSRSLRQLAEGEADLGASIRRMRLPEVTDEAAQAQRIPARGVFRKAGEGVTKQTPLPSPRVVRDRLEEANRALRRLEIMADAPWKPVERGVFDRSAFDPNFRLAAGTNTMPAATGRGSEALASLLDNKHLRDLTDRQVVLGLRQGGTGFYNLQPIAASFDEMGGPVTFRDFVNAGSAGSIQAPLPLEMSNASIMLFARENGIPYEEAIAEMMRRFPDANNPWISRTHFQKFDQYRNTGAINPSGPASGSRKVPYYSRQKMGESTGVGGTMGPVVDTHESKAVLYPIGGERYIDNLTGSEYEQVGDFYRDRARAMGIPVETYQAGRWIGGGPLTGLKSPRGDYTQGLEDVLAWSAQQMGRASDPKSLRRYWQDVAQGRDFILPYYGAGAPPVK